MSAWGCPHDLQGVCQKVAQRSCDPGMKGCVLAGRYVFANSDEKNKRLYTKQARSSGFKQSVGNHAGAADQ